MNFKMKLNERKNYMKDFQNLTSAEKEQTTFEVQRVILLYIAYRLGLVKKGEIEKVVKELIKD